MATRGVGRPVLAILTLSCLLVGCSGGRPSVVYDASKGDKPFPAVVSDKSVGKKAEGFPSVGQGPRK